MMYGALGKQLQEPREHRYECIIPDRATCLGPPPLVSGRGGHQEKNPNSRAMGCIHLAETGYGLHVQDRRSWKKKGHSVGCIPWNPSFGSEVWQKKTRQKLKAVRRSDAGPRMSEVMG